MSKIPRSHLSSNIKCTSTPFNLSKRNNEALKIEPNGSLFSDNSDFCSENSFSTSMTTPLKPIQNINTLNNKTLKRNAISMQHLPEKHPKSNQTYATSVKLSLNEYKNKYNEILKKYQDLKTLYDDMVKKSNQYFEELKNINCKLDEIKNENINLNEQVLLSSTDNEKFKCDLEDKEKSISNLKKLLEIQQSQNSDLLNENNTLLVQLSNIEKQISFKTTEYEALKNMLNSEIKKCIELSSIIEENQMKLSSYSSEILILKMKQNLLQEKNDENIVVFSKLSIENEKLKDSITTITNENSKITLKLKEKENECKKFENMYSFENIKCQEVNETVKNLQIKISEYLNEINKQQLCNNFLKSENENYLKQIKNQSDYIEDMKKMIQSMHENDKVLRNNIQDLKGHIRVFCRIRPLLQVEKNKHSLKIDLLDNCTMEIENIFNNFTPNSSRKSNNKHSFTFDGIFLPNTSQNEIFQEVSSLVQSALDGYNVCIFAYGQTGSGKTYTMEGEGESENLGIVPRAIDMIFSNVPKLNKLGWELIISASFLEIYNENIYDLLNSNKDQEDHSIKMVNSKATDVYVSNLKEEVVTNAEELKNLLLISQKNRKTAATVCNERSSRSHSITKIKFLAINQGRKEKFISNLNLVDLAGSESAKTSQRINETKSINKSLLELSSVILSLQSKQSHIPYRNSKLTHLLMASLGGNSKTLMLVNISQSEECFQETMNSLRFATKVNSCRNGISKKNVSSL